MPSDFIDVTPSNNAYTPNMAKFKNTLEDILNMSVDNSVEDREFREVVQNYILEIKGLMAILLMQDILYKAGVEYKPNRITGE